MAFPNYNTGGFQFPPRQNTGVIKPPSPGAPAPTFPRPPAPRAPTPGVVRPTAPGGSGMSSIRGGTQQGPTPWWQTSMGAGDRLGNLQRSAPAGYEYDPVQMSYVPTVGSAPTQQRLQERQISYQDEDRQRRNALLGGFRSAMQGLQSAGGYGQTVPGGNVPNVNYPQVSLGPIPDATAAQEAAFGSAKAQAGSLGRSALDSLRSELAERGMMGGGTEARGLVDILASSTNPLSDLNVSQQGERLGIAQHTQDLAAQQAATQYGGGITQRGQDIQNQQFQAQLAQQRALAAQQQKLQLLQQALSGLSNIY